MEDPREGLHEERVVLEDSEREQVPGHGRRAEPASRPLALRAMDEHRRAVVPERDAGEEQAEHRTRRRVEHVARQEDERLPQLRPRHQRPREREHDGKEDAELDGRKEHLASRGLGAPRHHPWQSAVKSGRVSPAMRGGIRPAVGTRGACALLVALLAAAVPTASAGCGGVDDRVPVAPSSRRSVRRWPSATRRCSWPCRTWPIIGYEANAHGCREWGEALAILRARRAAQHAAAHGGDRARRRRQRHPATSAGARAAVLHPPAGAGHQPRARRRLRLRRGDRARGGGHALQPRQAARLGPLQRRSRRLVSARRSAPDRLRRAGLHPPARDGAAVGLPEAQIKIRTPRVGGRPDGVGGSDAHRQPGPHRLCRRHRHRPARGPGPAGRAARRIDHPLATVTARRRTGRASVPRGADMALRPPPARTGRHHGGPAAPAQATATRHHPGVRAAIIGPRSPHRRARGPRGLEVRVRDRWGLGALTFRSAWRRPGALGCRPGSSAAGQRSTAGDQCPPPVQVAGSERCRWRYGRREHTGWSGSRPTARRHAAARRRRLRDADPRRFHRCRTCRATGWAWPRTPASAPAWRTRSSSTGRPMPASRHPRCARRHRHLHGCERRLRRRGPAWPAGRLLRPRLERRLRPLVAEMMRTYLRGTAGRVYWFLLPAPRRRTSSTCSTASTPASARPRGVSRAGCRWSMPTPSSRPATATATTWPTTATGSRSTSPTASTSPPPATPSRPGCWPAAARRSRDPLIRCSVDGRATAAPGRAGASRNGTSSQSSSAEVLPAQSQQYVWTSHKAQNTSILLSLNDYNDNNALVIIQCLITRTVNQAIYFEAINDQH